MVKWLKIDKQDKTSDAVEVRQNRHLYISKQAIIIGDERKYKPCHHSLAVLADQNKPYQNMLRKLQALRLDSHASTAHHNSYGVHISAVSSSQYQRNYASISKL